MYLRCFFVSSRHAIYIKHYNLEKRFKKYDNKPKHTYVEKQGGHDDLNHPLRWWTFS